MIHSKKTITNLFVCIENNFFYGIDNRKVGIENTTQTVKLLFIKKKVQILTKIVINRINSV
jgi:hypothetical protein